jgi:hypothetical protein
VKAGRGSAKASPKSHTFQAERKNGGSYFVSLISDKVSTASVMQAGDDVAFRVLTGSSVIGDEKVDFRDF